MRIQSLRVVVVAASMGLLALAACDEEPTEVESGDVPAFGVVTPAALAIENFESRGRTWHRRDQFTDLEARLPGFAGMYSDGDQIVVMMQPEASTRSEAVAQVGDFLVTHSDAVAEAPLRQQAAGLRLEPAVYNHRQLHAWYDMVKASVFPVVSANLGGIRYRSNRIHIGVQEAGDVEIARRIIEGLGVPGEAVNVAHEPREALDMTTYLSGTANPRVSGVQVSRDGIPWACSLGYSLDRAAGSGWYMITAGHCTENRGVVDGDTLGQPLITGTKIAYEVADIPLFEHADDAECPDEANHECTYADVALFKYITSTYQHGRFAYPNLGGDTTYTSVRQIGGTRTVLVNDDVQHIGRTTGRRDGEVTADCDDVEIKALDFWHLCYAKADYYSRPGDSGGPVLYFQTPLARPWLAVGMHLVGDTVTGEVWFAKTGAIHDALEDEYGSTYCETIFCTEDPSVSIVSGPTTMPSDLLCTWIASASGGVAPYSFSWSGVASGVGSSFEAIVNSGGTLTVTVTDDVGHTDSASLSITIDDNASAPPSCSQQ